MNDPLLIGLTSGAALLLAFLLFNHPKHNNVNANRWLALFMFGFAFSILEIFIHDLNLQDSHPVLVSFLEVSRYVSAPALYLSVVFFTSPTRKFSPKMLWHFVPFLIFLLFQLPRVLTGNNMEIPNRLVAQIIFTIFAATFPVQIITYWVLCVRKLQKHQKNIKRLASSTEAINLSWLEQFLYVIAGVVVIWLNLAFFNISSILGYTRPLYLLSIYFLAYYALDQKEVYAYPESTRQELDEMIKEDPEPKTEKQKRLSHTQTQHLKGKLDALMQHEKVYLDNELSLPGLAARMEISIHELSYLINDVYDENFFSFVNRYRVEEAKRLLLSQKSTQLTMLAIAFEAGFNSKTSFNTSFKKVTGLSPTEFLRSAGK